MLGTGFWAQDMCMQFLILCHHLLFPEVQVRGVGQPSWKSMPPLAALQHDLCSLPSTDRYVTALHSHLDPHSSFLVFFVISFYVLICRLMCLLTCFKLFDLPLQSPMQILFTLALHRYAVLSTRSTRCCGNMCREDVSNNLTLAVAPDDFKDESQLDANDFLIRGIIGMDPKGGAIAVGDTVGVGKRIRFMVGMLPLAPSSVRSLLLCSCQQS